MTPTALPSWSWRAIPISARASSLFHTEICVRGGNKKTREEEKIPGERTKEDKGESNGDIHKRVWGGGGGRWREESNGDIHKRVWGLVYLSF